MRTNGLTSRITALLVTFVFLFTLAPTAVLANVTDYTMSLECGNDTIKAGDTVTISVKLDGPMANIGLVQYSVQFDDEYASITVDEENFADPGCYDIEWFQKMGSNKELGYISAPTGNIGDGAFNVLFTSIQAKYINAYAPDNFYNATTTIAGKLKFTALKNIENPAEVFALTNCKVEHIVDNKRVPKTVTTVQLTDNEVENVKALIETIGDVTLNSKDEIESAEKAYQNLSLDKQGKVTNYWVLTEAREMYDGLVAKEVDALIDAIGEVNLGSSQAIIAAQNALNELSENQKKYVTKITVLDEAAQAYATIIEQAETAAANVDALINAIGTVTLESGDKINAAREAYDALVKGETGAEIFVTKLSVLEEAESTYKTLVNNKKIADEVIADINAIGEVTLATYATAKKAIEDARSGYNSLGDIANLVGEDIYKKLTDAEAELKKVEGVLDSIANAEQLIDAIGTVDLTKGDKITAAENAYNALSPEAQEYVENRNALKTARDTYNKLMADKAKVDAVIDAIESIGEVTLDSETAINAAKELYTNLDDILKADVTNKSTLDKAEAKLASLKKVKAVKEKIDAIGEVSLTSITAITEAEAAYKALSNEEKELVSNHNVLTEARAEYERLSALADKQEKDQAAAKVVDDMIANLGDITLNSKDALLQAEAGYESLTPDQKAYVQNLGTLEKARLTYDALVKEKEAIDAVDALILAIGEVKYTQDSKKKIDDAREAYKNLADNLKERVTKYTTLENAEARYEDLGKINAVIVLVENIGDISYTETCRKAIEAAENAYLELDDMLKPEMATEYAVLKEARKAYNALAPIVFESGEIQDYDNNHTLVITNIEAGRKVTVNGVDAKQIVTKDNVYYVLVSAEPIEEKNIIVDDTAPESEKHTLGDVDGKDGIDVLDAQKALKKAALINDDVFADSMAYVKADVNGDGRITARDAYLIAMAILDPAAADGFKVYNK